MPPKPKRTREQVIAAAIQIVRREGLGALTARSLAALLDVAPSTIFTHFSSMEELQRYALQTIRGMFTRRAASEAQHDDPFQTFGLELIRFAAEEPNLYATLFVSRPDTVESELTVSVRRLVEQARERFQLDQAAAERLCRDLGVYACGLATLSAAGAAAFSEEETRRMLGDACRAFLAAGAQGNED